MQVSKVSSVATHNLARQPQLLLSAGIIAVALLAGCAPRSAPEMSSPAFVPTTGSAGGVVVPNARPAMK